MTNSLLLNMAIEIVSFPIKGMVVLHSNIIIVVYQRVLQKLGRSTPLFLTTKSSRYLKTKSCINKTKVLLMQFFCGCFASERQNVPLSYFRIYTLLF